MMAQKRAFYDPNTRVLKCWGFVKSNEPGDIVRDVDDDFSLEPGKWKLSGNKHERVPDKPPRDKSDLDTSDRLIRAICTYFGKELGKSPAEIKAGIKKEYDELK